MPSSAVNNLRPNASMGTLRDEGKMATVLRLILLLRDDSVGRIPVVESSSVLTRDAIMRSSLGVSPQSVMSDVENARDQPTERLYRGFCRQTNRTMNHYSFNSE